MFEYVVYFYRNNRRNFYLVCFFFVFVGVSVRIFISFYFLVELVDIFLVRGFFVILNCSVYFEFFLNIEWKKDGIFLNLELDDRR